MQKRLLESEQSIRGLRDAFQKLIQQVKDRRRFGVSYFLGLPREPRVKPSPYRSAGPEVTRIPILDQKQKPFVAKDLTKLTNQLIELSQRKFQFKQRFFIGQQYGFCLLETLYQFALA